MGGGGFFSFCDFWAFGFVVNVVLRSTVTLVTMVNLCTCTSVQVPYAVLVIIILIMICVPDTFEMTVPQKLLNL